MPTFKKTMGGEASSTKELVTESTSWLNDEIQIGVERKNDVARSTGGNFQLGSLPTVQPPLPKTTREGAMSDTRRQKLGEVLPTNTPLLGREVRKERKGGREEPNTGDTEKKDTRWDKIDETEHQQMEIVQTLNQVGSACLLVLPRHTTRWRRGIVNDGQYEKETLAKYYGP